MQWFKGEVCIDNSPDYVITYNNGEAVLRFEQVFLEDQSDYTCKANNKMGTESVSAYLSVERKLKRIIKFFSVNKINANYFFLQL